MPIIAFHITNEAIVSSNGDIIKDNFLEFLIDKYQGYQKVCYDLDAGVASLCVLLKLSIEQCRKLSDGKLDLRNGFRLTYWTSHMLAVDYGYGTLHGFANFANMNQNAYLNAEYTEDNSIEDAIRKAKYAKQIAEESYETLIILGCKNPSLISPTSSFIKSTKIDEFMPTIDDCPKRVSELSRESITGQWFQAYSLGHWQEAWDYDLNSSYSACMAQLPNIRQGTWQESPVVMPDAILGIAKGQLTIDAPFHPFLINLGGSDNTLNGKYPLTLTLDAINFLNKWNLGIFDIREGYWFIPNKNCSRPYAGTMQWLHTKKQSFTNKRARNLCTSLYSSIWGRQNQVLNDGSFGDMVCPIIAKTVENNSQLKVADACLSNGIIPLIVMADGFVSDKPCNLPISKKLGEWKLSAHGKCIIVGSGTVAFEGDTPPEGLALSYNNLVELINKNPEASEYTRSKYSPVLLATALKDDGKYFNKLGTIHKISRKITIGADTKRFYLSAPQNGRDLLSNQYTSLPLSHEILTSQTI